MNFTKDQAWFINLWTRMRCDVPPEMSETHEFFSLCFVKTARFPWNLVHKKRKVFSIYFSKICAWNVISTPLLPLIPSVNLLRQEIMLFLCSLCYNVWETFLFNVMVFVFPIFLGLEFSYTVWFFLVFFFIKIKSWQCNLYLYY